MTSTVLTPITIGTVMLIGSAVIKSWNGVYVSLAWLGLWGLITVAHLHSAKTNKVENE